MSRTSLWKKFSEDEIRKFFDQSENRQDFFLKMGYKAISASAYQDIRKQYPWIAFNRYKDLTNQTFGNLTALKKVGCRPSQSRSAEWLCRCNRCGKEIITTADCLQRGHTKSCGCLISLGEDKIALILKDSGIKFERQKTFPDLYGDMRRLKFDFYLPDFNILIEFQGRQHYQPVEIFGGQQTFELQQRYDKLKRDYCISNHIILREISYEELNNISLDMILGNLSN